MSKITPFLWFDTQAEEAARFYVSIFKDASVDSVVPYPEGSPGNAGSAMIVSFTLRGQAFTALNGGPQFTFNPSISFVISCDEQAEVDYFYDSLLEGGTESMCGWLQDRYGLSWQIVPKALSELMTAASPAQASAVMGALMQMRKLDIQTLRDAFNANA